MQTIAYHKHFNQSAQQCGMPTYWSAIEINSDRTPEFTSGSMEDRVS
jgi:hypothetical protein